MPLEKYTKIPLPNRFIVIAGSFNPTIIQPSFLRRYKILTEQEIAASEIEDDEKQESKAQMGIVVPRLLISGGQTILIFQNLVFEVTRDRFQVTLKTGSDPKIATDSIKKLFTVLEHTPVTAIGFNFIAHWKTSGGRDRLNKLFTGDSSVFSKVFGNKVSVGGRVRFEYLNSKVLLETEPSAQMENGVYFNFNFHFDLAPPSAEMLVKRLVNFEKTMAYAESVATQLYGTPSHVLAPAGAFELLGEHHK